MADFESQGVGRCGGPGVVPAVYYGVANRTVCEHG